MIERILVTVKTYPHPSKSYQELVCTAGIRENGSFIRLYPVDFRYRLPHQWYEKYQWIEVDITKNESDPRPESYRPKFDGIQNSGRANFDCQQLGGAEAPYIATIAQDYVWITCRV